MISPLPTQPCCGWVWQEKGRGNVPHLLHPSEKHYPVAQTAEGISESLALRASVSSGFWGAQGS